MLTNSKNLGLTNLKASNEIYEIWVGTKNIPSDSKNPFKSASNNRSTNIIDTQEEHHFITGIFPKLFFQHNNKEG
jgi:hypothetical protein